MNLSAKCSSTKTERRGIRLAIACGLLLTLPACGIPDLRKPAPGPAIEPDPGEAAASENSARLGIDEFFNDPKLTCLITAALAGNQEQKILAEDVQIASNQILGRRGAYLPLLSFGARTGIDKASKYTVEGAGIRDDPYQPGQFLSNPHGNHGLGVNLTWQIDIWRQLRNARDAAILRYLSSNEARNYYVTRLVAEIADNYYRLLALDQRMLILDQIIALQEQSLRVAEARKEFVRDTELGVQRFLAEVRKNQSEKLIVRQEIIEVENRINFLVGRFPQPVDRASGNFIDLALHPISAGVPAQLLENRPDIRQAERDLEATGLDVKVARANFFPKVFINSGVGYAAFNAKYLLVTPEALIYNVAGDLVAPLVNKRAIQAEYLDANARQLQAVYNYQRTVLEAVTDVINRLAKVSNYRQSIEIKRQQLAALERSVEIASQLFQSARPGFDYVDVLFAQRDLIDAQVTLVETKQQELSAVVNLYQAIGGGNLMPIYVPEVPQPHRWLMRLMHTDVSEAAGTGPKLLPPPPGHRNPAPVPPLAPEPTPEPPPLPSAETGPFQPPAPEPESDAGPLEPTGAEGETGPLPPPLRVDSPPDTGSVPGDPPG